MTRAVKLSLSKLRKEAQPKPGSPLGKLQRMFLPPVPAVPADALSPDQLVAQLKQIPVNRQVIDADLKRRLRQILLQFAGISFAGGAALRGAEGLASQLGAARTKPIPSVPLPRRVGIPVTDVPVEEQAQKQAQTGLTERAAGAVGDTVVQGASDFANYIGKGLSGGFANSPYMLPGAIVGVPAAGLVGAAGGYKLVDWLLDKYRKEEADRELARAKQEYMNVLLGKSAGAELSAELDALYDNLVARYRRVKQAQFPGQDPPAAERLGELLGPIGGMMLLTALFSGGLGAAGGWKIGKDRQKRKLLEQAQRARRLQLYSRQPSPLVAVPLPMHLDQQQSPQESRQVAPRLTF